MKTFPLVYNVPVLICSVFPSLYLPIKICKDFNILFISLIHRTCIYIFTCVLIQVTLEQCHEICPVTFSLSCLLNDNNCNFNGPAV